VLDINYARKLARIPNLSLIDIMLLDKVQKWKELTKDEIKILRKKKLIEWKSPNFIISSDIASETDQKSEYIQLRGIDDEYSKKIILDYIKKFWKATRKDLERTLIVKLPDILSEQQKKDKIKNLLQSLKKSGKIIVDEKSKDRARILTSSES
jgi:ATP-dependent DNA helicase RecG